MHPPLEAHKEEGCDDVIQALKDCHNVGTFNKFIGSCNSAKTAVDKCLKEEFLAMRQLNKGAAVEKRKKMEQIWKEIDEPPAFAKDL